MERDLESRLDYENKARRIDVIRALIGVDGNLTMTSTEGCKDGSFVLHGYKRDFDEVESVKYHLGADEVKLLLEAKTFTEIYEIYKEIGYFEVE